MARHKVDHTAELRKALRALSSDAILLAIDLKHLAKDIDKVMSIGHAKLKNHMQRISYIKRVNLKSSQHADSLSKKRNEKK